MVPIAWIRNRRKELAERAEAERARGRCTRTRRAEAAGERLDAWVKQVGATDQAVANKLKTDKGRLARTEKAIARVHADIASAEKQIEEAKERIVALRAEECSHQGRRGTLLERIAYLSSQVYAAAVPSREEEIRRALERMRQIGEPVLQAALDVLAPMVSPPEGALAAFNIATGDTTSDDDAHLDSNDDNADPPPCASHPPPRAGTGNETVVAAAAAELADAKAALRQLCDARDADLQNAVASAARRKRQLDGDDAKPTDGDGDDSMGATAIEDQVRQAYAARIEEARGRVHIFADALGRLQSRQMDEAHGGQLEAAAATTASASPSTIPLVGGAVPGVHDAERQIAEQEALQQQQDLEFEERQRAAALREDKRRRFLAAASEVEASRAGTFGPTGQDLTEHQLAFARPSPPADVRRPPRWGRPASAARGRAPSRSSSLPRRRARTKSPRPAGVAADALASAAL